jgi:hypothetical protein
MWREYFPDAEIFGLDGQQQLLFQEERIKTHICDLGSLESLERAASWVGTRLDIVFDDGSHQPQHQIDTAEVFVPLLSENGIYIIEDVGYPLRVKNAIENDLHYKCEVVNFDINRLTLDDDRLVVIRA